jgi:hypothetical protein
MRVRAEILIESINCVLIWIKNNSFNVVVHKISKESLLNNVYIYIINR